MGCSDSSDFGNSRCSRRRAATSATGPSLAADPVRTGTIVRPHRHLFAVGATLLLKSRPSDSRSPLDFGGEQETAGGLRDIEELHYTPSGSCRHASPHSSHGLPAVLEVEDTQRAAADSGTVPAENQTGGLVRAAMHDRPPHAVERVTSFSVAKVHVENACDSAHQRSGARTPYRRLTASRVQGRRPMRSVSQTACWLQIRAI